MLFRASTLGGATQPMNGELTTAAAASPPNKTGGQDPTGAAREGGREEEQTPAPGSGPCDGSLGVGCMKTQMMENDDRSISTGRLSFLSTPEHPHSGGGSLLQGRLSLEFLLAVPG